MQSGQDRNRYATGQAPGRPPDQAEGERHPKDGHPAPAEARRPTPSQAEGDREMVEHSLRGKQRRTT